MIRTIYFYLALIISLIAKLPLMYKVNCMTVGKDEFVYKVVSGWAKNRIRTTGSSISISGGENLPEGPCLFVSNHQSNFDIPAILAYVEKPLGFVSKDDIKKVPIVRRWMEYINCIFLDRSDTSQALKSILDAIKLLKSGKSLWVFPEGTRSKSSNVAEFKEGSIVMATKAKVPIVPVTINGTYKIMEANGKIIKPAKVFLTIHEPIDTSNISKEEASSLSDKIRNMIIDSLNK